MQALDIFHDVVKHALEKDGWLITNHPLFRRFGELDMYIDLGGAIRWLMNHGNQSVHN
ncbi:element excision factor XisH family protein [Nostoc sp.]